MEEMKMYSKHSGTEFRLGCGWAGRGPCGWVGRMFMFSRRIRAPKIHIFKFFMSLYLPENDDKKKKKNTT